MKGYCEIITIRRRSAKRLLLVCLAIVPMIAEPPEVRIRSAAWFPPSLVIKTDVNLVELAAVVRGPRGGPISGLRAADFEVLDNNQPREITFFSEQRAQMTGAAVAAAPTEPARAASPSTASAPRRSIALFFDDAHASMLGVRKSAEAAEKLVAHALAPTDLAGIFTSSGTVSVDFTADRSLLLRALARLQPHPLAGVHATTQCPTLGPSEAYIIAQHQDIEVEDAAVAEAVGCYCPNPSQLRSCTVQQREVVRSVAQNVWEQYEYQSTTALDVLLIVIRHLAAAPGERLLILMSPGFPTGGMEERISALTDVALRANITISALNSEGLVAERLASRKLFLLSGFMADAAKSTGGKYMHDTNDWAGSLRALAAVPEASYLLGFSPPGAPDGKYHSLRTRVRDHRDYRIESRPGYYASAGASERETTQQRIERVAMSENDIREFPVTLQVQQGPTKEGHVTLLVTVAVDANGLRFAEKEGRRVQELAFLTLLEDAGGNFVAGKQSVMDMALTSTSHAEMLQKGIQAATSFPLTRGGSYRVREVVRELVQNRIWASSAAIEVP